MAISVDPGSPATATVASGSFATITAAVTTQGADRLLVAVVAWGGYDYAASPLTVSSPGLTWTRRGQASNDAGAYARWVGAEVWTAPAAAQLTSHVVTATKTDTADTGVAALEVFALAGTTGVGAVATIGGDGATTRAHAVALTAQAAGSLVVGAAVTGSAAATWAAVSGTTLDAQTSRAEPTSTVAVFHRTALTAGAGSVTVGASGSDTYSATVAVEILAAASDARTGTATSLAGAAALGAAAGAKAASGPGANLAGSATLGAASGSAGASSDRSGTATTLAGSGDLGSATGSRAAAGAGAALAGSATLGQATGSNGAAPATWLGSAPTGSRIFDVGEPCGVAGDSGGRADTVILVAGGGLSGGTDLMVAWGTVGQGGALSTQVVAAGATIIATAACQDSGSHALHVLAAESSDGGASVVQVHYYRLTATRDGGGYITGWATAAHHTLGTGATHRLLTPWIGEVVDGNGAKRLAGHGQLAGGTGGNTQTAFFCTTAGAGVAPTQTSDWGGASGGAFTVIMSSLSGDAWYTQQTGAQHTTSRVIDCVSCSGLHSGSMYLVRLTPSGSTWSVGAQSTLATGTHGDAFACPGPGDAVWLSYASGTSHRIGTVAGDGTWTADAVASPNTAVPDYPAASGFGVTPDGRLLVIEPTSGGSATRGRVYESGAWGPWQSIGSVGATVEYSSLRGLAAYAGKVWAVAATVYDSSTGYLSALGADAVEARSGVAGALSGVGALGSAAGARDAAGATAPLVGAATLSGASGARAVPGAAGGLAGSAALGSAAGARMASGPASEVAGAASAGLAAGSRAGVGAVGALAGEAAVGPCAGARASGGDAAALSGAAALGSASGYATGGEEARSGAGQPVAGGTFLGGAAGARAASGTAQDLAGAGSLGDAAGARAVGGAAAGLLAALDAGLAAGTRSASGAAAALAGAATLGAAAGTALAVEDRSGSCQGLVGAAASGPLAGARAGVGPAQSCASAAALGALQGYSERAGSAAALAGLAALWPGSGAQGAAMTASTAILRATPCRAGLRATRVTVGQRARRTSDG